MLLKETNTIACPWPDVDQWLLLLVEELQFSDIVHENQPVALKIIQEQKITKCFIYLSWNVFIP